MPRSAATIDVPLLLPAEAPAREQALRHFLRHVREEAGVRAAEVRDTPLNGAPQPTLHVTLNPRTTPLEALHRIARHSGIEFRERWGSVLWRVEGMVSPKSEEAIEAALADLANVHASASFASKTVRIEFDRQSCALPEVAMRLARLGFRVRPARGPRAAAPLRRSVAERVAWVWSIPREYAEFTAAALGGALLAAGFLAEKAGGAPPAATLPIYILAAVAAGWFTARDTALSLARFRFNIDVLMFVAAIGAGLLGHMAEGALLLVLFALGHAGEDMAMSRARKAIQALHEIVPDTANRIEPDGSVRAVRAEELAVADRVLVRPGERIPADGAVVEGVSAVDQAAITGESVPVEKSAGSPVFAGTVNGDGALTIAVEKPSTETTLAKAIRLVEEAQTRKSPTELFTARIERWYVPAVLIATGALLVVMPIAAGGAFEHWKTWFYRSMAFLTAASPCALAIGTPAAVLSALARAARMGVLIKGGAHLETLGKVRAVAFDKTGTLTLGRPRVAAVRPLAGADESAALFAAAAVEAASAHPLAQAIVEEARARGWDGAHASSVEQAVGRGLRGIVAGETVEVGSLRLFADDPRAGEVRPIIESLEREGATAVAVRRAGAFVAVIALADTERPEAAAMIRGLRALGVRRTVMLTGDNKHVAAAVASRLELDEFHAGLLPEDKMDAIADLRRREGVVAMLGDGVNDAPALAAASLGVAMGVAGSDVALETADVALMHDDLSRFTGAIRLGRSARAVIRQNLVIAMGVIAVLAPLAAAGYTTIGWAVVFHEGSTVVVALNALRLLRRSAAE
ncbi:MAG: heavy metal translocating P-type ATPase [Phycisphaerales bacterium]|nr:heavy metal translocating P-type ATPase [Phycisphaerales bacterium]